MRRQRLPTARDMMTTSLLTLRPEMPAPEAARILVRRRVSGAPVVDDDGRLLGLLSEYDCLRAVAAAEYEHDFHDTVETVGELMTRDCHTLSPDVDLFGVAHEFLQLHVRRLPVLEAGLLIGQVSRRDVMKAALEFRRTAVASGRGYPDYPRGREPESEVPHWLR